MHEKIVFFFHSINLWGFLSHSPESPFQSEQKVDQEISWTKTSYTPSISKISKMYLDILFQIYNRVINFKKYFLKLKFYVLKTIFWNIILEKNSKI